MNKSAPPYFWESVLYNGLRNPPQTRVTNGHCREGINIIDILEKLKLSWLSS